MLFRFKFIICLLYIAFCEASKIESNSTTNVEGDNRWRKREIEELSNTLLELSRTKEYSLSQLVLKIPEIGWAVPFTKGRGDGKGANLRNIFNQCNADLLRLTLSITQKWTHGLIDSFGKIPSGFMKGTFLWPGDFDECQNFESPQTFLFPKRLQGRYCLMSLGNGNPMGLSSITTAVCVPRSCSTSELNEDLSTLLSLLNNISIIGKVSNTLPKISVTCLPEKVPLTSASIVCIILLVIIFGLTVAGTTYDIWKRYSVYLKQAQVEQDQAVEEKFVNGNYGNSVKMNDNSTIVPEEEKRKNDVADFLLCFSALANAKAILDTSSRPGQLNCLHGIRFISMTWVILGHTYVFGITSYANILDVLNMFHEWPFQAISTAPFSVDTFFLLSGFLVSYLFLKERSAFSLKKLGYFYFHRYIRLTPVYMVVLFFYATVFNFIGDGPYWGYASQEVNMCTRYWWRNLFYISNFFQNTDMCMGWSWYLDNDMQFFIICPLFLVLFKSSKAKKRWLGLAVLLSLLLASWIYTGVFVKVKNYPVMFNAVSGNGNGMESVMAQTSMFDTVYDKPWTRIGPYLVGCLTAVVLVDLGKSPKLFTRLSVILCWLGATALALVNVYGLYNQEISIATSAFYNALTRSAWALSVAWVIVACLTENGGVVNKFLSWKFWFPLSRLTYCGYLVHPMIMYFYFQTLRTPMYITHTVVAIHFLGFVVLTYGLAFVTSITVEAPVIKLEKLIRQKLVS